MFVVGNYFFVVFKGFMDEIWKIVWVVLSSDCVVFSIWCFELFYVVVMLLCYVFSCSMCGDECMFEVV